MELFRDVAHQHGTGVIVVTHDHRALDVFDTIYEMEDGFLTLVPASEESETRSWCAGQAARDVAGLEPPPLDSNRQPDAGTVPRSLRHEAR